jgi:hypothetical protein
MNAGEGDCFGCEYFNQFMFDQTIANICAVFDLVAVYQAQAADTQLFIQAPISARQSRFIPKGVRTARIRPKTGCVVFGQSATLDQSFIATHHEY